MITLEVLRRLAPAAPALFGAGAFLGLVMTFLSIKLAGVTRATKILFAFTMSCLLAFYALTSGLWVAVGTIGVALLAGFVAGCFSALGWRAPERQDLVPAPGAVPEFAKPTVEKWSADVFGLGWTEVKDGESSWSQRGRARKIFTRVAYARGHDLWAVIAVTTTPRSVSRSFNTLWPDGSALMTADRQQDLFRDPLVTAQVLSEGSRAAELLEAHRKALDSLSRVHGAPLAVDDPWPLAQRARAASVERLVRAGKLVRTGDGQLRIPLASAVRVQLELWKRFVS